MPPYEQEEVVGRGERLTDREQEILSCIQQGLTNPAIAIRLRISTNTVRNHVNNILMKLGVHSKLEVVVLTGVDRGAIVRN